jgi:hypothetical protein
VVETEITLLEATDRLGQGGDLTDEEKLSLMWQTSEARRLIYRELAERDRKRHPERYVPQAERDRREREEQESAQRMATLNAAIEREERRQAANMPLPPEKKPVKAIDRGAYVVLTDNY